MRFASFPGHKMYSCLRCGRSAGTALLTRPTFLRGICRKLRIVENERSKSDMTGSIDSSTGCTMFVEFAKPERVQSGSSLLKMLRRK